MKHMTPTWHTISHDKAMINVHECRIIYVVIYSFIESFLYVNYVQFVYDNLLVLIKMKSICVSMIVTNNEATARSIKSGTLDD